MESTAEGCVADDDLAYLYVAEEIVGIWKYEAEPGGGSSRVPVDQVGSTLEADVEGLTIYYGPDGAGYLIASSQGSGQYATYDRTGDNEHLSNFQIVDSASVDGTSSTDGIDVMSAPLGAGFPNGLFVAQDGDNDSGNQNFKLVPWDVVAGAPNPSLAIETGWNPRGDSPTNLTHVPLPSDITTTPSNWSVGRTAVSAAEEDGQLATDGTVEAGTELVFDPGRTVALEFPGLNVPADSTIRSAYVQFTAAVVDDSDLVLSISGVIDGGGAETETVTWAPAGWDADERGVFQQTPDLSAIIREIARDARMGTGREPEVGRTPGGCWPASGRSLRGRRRAGSWTSSRVCGGQMNGENMNGGDGKPKDNRQTIIIVLAVVLTILVGLVVGFLATGGLSQEPAAAPTTTPAPPDSVDAPSTTAVPPTSPTVSMPPGQTAVTASEDTSVNSGQPEEINGFEDVLEIENDPPENKQALIRFWSAISPRAKRFRASR